MPTFVSGQTAVQPIAARTQTEDVDTDRQTQVTILDPPADIALPASDVADQDSRVNGLVVAGGVAVALAVSGLFLFALGFGVWYAIRDKGKHIPARDIASGSVRPPGTAGQKEPPAKKPAETPPDAKPSVQPPGEVAPANTLPAETLSVPAESTPPPPVVENVVPPSSAPAAVETPAPTPTPTPTPVSATPAGVEAVTGQLGARLVLSNGYRAAFSPDGKRLAAAKWEGGVVLIDLATGDNTLLIRDGKDPVWRPKGGELIAYVTGNAKTEEVWIVNPLGRNPRKISAGGYPTWSADGKTLYFQSRTSAKIHGVNIDGSAPKVKVEIDIPFSWYPAVSPNGQLVAYFLNQQLQIFDVRTSKVIFSQPLPKWPGAVPGWSPDSKQVAYGSFGNGFEGGLWLLDVDSKRVCEIAPGSFTSPAWSLDGKQFAFDNRERSKYGIYVMEAGRLPTP
jgi:hypothetical protein